MVGFGKKQEAQSVITSDNQFGELSEQNLNNLKPTCSKICPRMWLNYSTQSDVFGYYSGRKDILYELNFSFSRFWLPMAELWQKFLL